MCGLKRKSPISSTRLMKLRFVGCLVLNCFVIERESWFTKILVQPESLFAIFRFPNKTINYYLLVFIEFHVVASIKRAFFKTFKSFVFGSQSNVRSSSPQNDWCGIIFIDQLNGLEIRASTFRLTTIKVTFVYNWIIIEIDCAHFWDRGFSFMHIHFTYDPISAHR